MLFQPHPLAGSGLQSTGLPLSEHTIREFASAMRVQRHLNPLASCGHGGRSTLVTAFQR